MNGRILHIDYPKQRIYDVTSSIVSFLSTVNFNAIDWIIFSLIDFFVWVEFFVNY